VKGVWLVLFWFGCSGLCVAGLLDLCVAGLLDLCVAGLFLLVCSVCWFACGLGCSVLLICLVILIGTRIIV